MVGEIRKFDPGTKVDRTAGPLTLANKLTLARFICIPILVISLLRQRELSAEAREPWLWLAFAAFVAAGFTDFLDGYLARKRNEISRLGAILDPLADKALSITTALLIAFDSTGSFVHLPSWFLVLLLVREAIIVLGSVVLHLMGGMHTPRPHWTGKAASGLTMATLAWILAFRRGTALSHVAPFLIWIDAGLIVVSGFRYLWMGLMYLQALDVDHDNPGLESDASDPVPESWSEGKDEG